MEGASPGGALALDEYPPALSSLPVTNPTRNQARGVSRGASSAMTRPWPRDVSHLSTGSGSAAWEAVLLGLEGNGVAGLLPRSVWVYPAVGIFHVPGFVPTGILLSMVDPTTLAANPAFQVTLLPLSAARVDACQVSMEMALTSRTLPLDNRPVLTVP